MRYGEVWEKLFSERNFQISRKKNRKRIGILGKKAVADRRFFVIGSASRRVGGG